MRPVLNALLFLLWVSAYLTVVACLARYRKARAHALGNAVQSDYRADKDVGLWVAMMVLGVLLFWLVHLATMTIGRLF
jgi:hypothetical protein